MPGTHWRLSHCSTPKSSNPAGFTSTFCKMPRKRAGPFKTPAARMQKLPWMPTPPDSARSSCRLSSSARTHACRVHTRVNAPILPEPLCSQECEHGTHDCVRYKSLRRQREEIPVLILDYRRSPPGRFHGRLLKLHSSRAELVVSLLHIVAHEHHGVTAVYAQFDPALLAVEGLVRHNFETKLLSRGAHARSGGSR